MATSEDDKGLEIVHVEAGEQVCKVDTGTAPIAQWSPRNYSLAYALHDPGNGGLRIINAADIV